MLVAAANDDVYSRLGLGFGLGFGFVGALTTLSASSVLGIPVPPPPVDGVQQKRWELRAAENIGSVVQSSASVERTFQDHGTSWLRRRRWRH